MNEEGKILIISMAIESVMASLAYTFYLDEATTYLIYFDIGFRKYVSVQVSIELISII